MEQTLKILSISAICAGLLLCSGCSSKQKEPEPAPEYEGSSETVSDTGPLSQPLSEPLSDPLDGTLEPVGNGVQAKVDVRSKSFGIHTDIIDGTSAVTLLISGTLDNAESTPAVCMTIKGTAYNSTGTVLASDESSMLEEIAARSESRFAFSLQLPEGISGQDVSTIKVEPTCERRSTERPVLQADPSLIQVVAKHIEINSSAQNGPTAILTGVVENAGTKPLEFASASGSIFDASGSLLGKQKGIVYPAIVAPGKRGYIALEFEIADTTKLTDITRQWLDFSYFTTTASVGYFTIPESHRNADDMSVWAILGSIELPAEDADLPTVVVLMYNKENQLIDLDLGHTSTASTTARSVISFQASTTRLLDLIDRYEVLAFSDKK